MRVVVDTNVLISAGLKADTAPRIAVRWIAQHATLLKSHATEEELRRTLARPKLADILQRGEFLTQLIKLVEGAELISITEPVQTCRDADDDKFLELAVSGHADVIVSGDADLLVLETFRGIPIIDPAAFIQGVAG